MGETAQKTGDAPTSTLEYNVLLGIDDFMSSRVSPPEPPVFSRALWNTLAGKARLRL